MDIFEFRMMRAALRQALRDMSNEMSEEDMNRILDQINVLTKVIEELEEEN